MHSLYTKQRFMNVQYSVYTGGCLIERPVLRISDISAVMVGVALGNTVFTSFWSTKYENWFNTSFSQ